jgi:hypothetical protein
MTDPGERRGAIVRLHAEGWNIAGYRVLLSAVTEYGAPEAIVIDGGSIFKAKRALGIYTALEIEKEQIQRRQPWQSYIETNFNFSVPAAWIGRATCGSATGASMENAALPIRPHRSG